MKRILTAVQPTNNLTIGNYLGSIDEIVKFQKDNNNEIFIFIADLHSITVPYDSQKLTSYIYNTLATYISCGIDPTKTTIFLQSHISEHSELKHLLSPFVSVGDLTRMHQFKDKQNGKFVPLALLDYPVLMAADILLYKPDIIPVGQDQIQHIELMKDIAISFNNKHNYFNIPEMHLSNSAKIYSLQDPLKKMSKSDPNQNATIFLNDSKDIIIKKIKKSVTDSFSTIEYSSDPARVGLKNLLDLYSTFSNKPLDQILNYFQHKQYGQFKQELGELIGDHIDPISKKIQELTENNQDYLTEVLVSGSNKAKIIANQNINDIKNIMGFPLLSKKDVP